MTVVLKTMQDLKGWEQIKLYYKGVKDECFYYSNYNDGVQWFSKYYRGKSMSLRKG